MQFRAAILYMALFVVIAAGAYGVVATAESPHVTADGVDAEYTLTEGDEFEVGGQTFNVTQVGDGSGTAEYVNEEAELEVQWDDGGTVLVDEDTEYEVVINQPGDEEDGGNESGDGNESAAGDGNESDGGNETAEGDGNETAEDEASPESFTLRESFDEDEYETLEDEDGELYIVTGDGEHVHIDDFEEINSTTYEVGDTVEFYDEEGEEMVEGEVTDIGSETVTVGYTGVEVEDYDLEHGDTVTLNDEEFAVYVSGDEVILSSDLDALEAQHEEVEDFNDRIRGLWWSFSLSILAAIVIGGLAFMPVRG